MMAVLVVLVAALVAAGIVMELTGEAVRRNSEQASNFLIKERTIYSLLIDMETSMRGYIIADDESFLEPYEQATAVLPGAWSELGALAADIDRQTGATDARVTPPLASLVTEMRSRAQIWQREAAEPAIELRRQDREEEVEGFLASGVGKVRFDSFREANARTTAQVERLLDQYDTQLRVINELHLGLVIGLGLLALAGVFVTMRVTRRQAQLQQEATREAEAETARLQTILENLPVAVRLVSGTTGNVVLQNQAASALLPANIWNRLSPEERPRYFNFARLDGTPLRHDELPGIKTRHEGVTITDFEFQMSSPETGTKVLVASTAPLRDASGKIAAAVIVLQDVTRMKEIDQRKDEFIATAAHELRNPLAALSGYNQLLQRMIAQTDSPPQVVKNLTQMDKQIKRLNKLVEQLLDASRIELGKLSLNRSRTDLVEVASIATSNARATDEAEPALSAAKGRAVEVDAPHGQVVGNWDATRLEQVVTNLVSNALRYSPSDAPVQIRVTQQKGDARLEVIDRGPGVPPEQREHLFDRYYQTTPRGAGYRQGADLSREAANLRRGQGLGLGLHISSEIIKAHGGRIGVEPNPDGGSIFWFTLPGVEAKRQSA